LQGMYKEGLLAQDFATMEFPQAGQQLAASMVGISYGSFPMPLLFLGANVANDPEADWLILPILTVDGSPPMPQSYTSGVSSFVFVKKGMAHPEAVVKVINLNVQPEPPDTEIRNPEDIDVEIESQRNKYRFAGGLERPGRILDMHIHVMDAFATGDTSRLIPEEMLTYEQVIYSRETRGDGYFMLIGSEPNTTFYLMRKNFESRHYLVNGFMGLPTETMIAQETLLITELNVAVFAVIMGEDISVWDAAVESWKIGGGNDITREVNEWYAANK